MQRTVAGIGKWMTTTVWRDGGQRTARRNAWAAMVDDSQRSRLRAEAEAALARLDGEPVSAAQR